MSVSELPAELPLSQDFGAGALAAAEVPVSQDCGTSALEAVLTGGAVCGRLFCHFSGGLSFEKSRRGT